MGSAAGRPAGWVRDPGMGMGGSGTELRRWGRGVQEQSSGGGGGVVQEQSSVSQGSKEDGAETLYGNRGRQKRGQIGMRGELGTFMGMRLGLLWGWKRE